MRFSRILVATILGAFSPLLPSNAEDCGYLYTSAEDSNQDLYTQSPALGCSNGMPIYRGTAVTANQEDEDYIQEFYIRSDGKKMKATKRTPAVKVATNFDPSWDPVVDYAWKEAPDYRPAPSLSRPSGRSLASIPSPSNTPEAPKFSTADSYRKAYAAFLKSKKAGSLKVEKIKGSSWVKRITTEDGTIILKDAKGFSATLNQYNEWVITDPKGKFYKLLLN